MSYAPYPAYKENKIPWLGAIPEGWDVKALRYIGKPIIGLTYSPTEVVGENEGTLVLRASNIQKGKISLHDNVYVSADVPEKLRIKAGDILVCSRNGSRHLIGKNALIEEDHDDWSFGAFTTVIRSEYGPFLYWVMNSKMFEYQSGRFLTTTINQLTTGVLNTFEIPFPPIEEQTAIADFLDEKTIEIDDLIAKKEELLRLLAEQRTALITHAVTNGLNPNAPMKPSGIDWLGDVPEGWKVKKIKYLVNYIGSGKTPRGGAEIYTDEGVMILRSQNIYDDGLRLKDVAYVPEAVEALQRNTRVRPGDVLLNITGASIGRSSLVPDDLPDANVNQHVCIFRSLPQKLDSRFLHAFFCSRAGKEQVSSNENGTSREGLNFQQAGNLTLALPPLELQTKIVQHLDIEIGELDKVVKKTTHTIERLKEYRTALITNAVTGKIKVA